MTWTLDNVSCASCAATIEAEVAKQSGVKKTTLNFVTKRMTVETKEAKDDAFWKHLETIAKKQEPSLCLVRNTPSSKRLYTVSGIDCPVCAAKVETALANIEGVQNVRLDFAENRLSVEVSNPALFETVASKAKQVEPTITLLEIEEKNTKTLKQVRILTPTFWRIVGALCTFTLGMVFHLDALVLFSYLVAGYDVLYKAFRNLLHGKIFDEHFLMSVATIGAMAIAQFEEGAAVMIFYLVGEYFQNLAVSKSRKSIVAALDLRSEQARVVDGEKLKMVSPEEVLVGQTIRVLVGEKIPLDGIVLSGSSDLDTKALTGESVPRFVQMGDEILSSSVNLASVLDIKVTKPYEQSTVAKILHLVEDAASHKAQTEQFITKFARYYTPVVVLLAVLLALIPSLFTGDWSTWVYRALVFLVVSCPCALVISIPLSYFAGIGKSATLGILVKGGNFLEAINETDTMVFDKTGTLTQGVFSIQGLYRTNAARATDEAQLLAMTAALERNSNHPLARAFDAVHTELQATAVTELPGKGLVGLVEGKRVAAGNRRLFEELDIPFLGSETDDYTGIHFALEGEHLASFALSDASRKEARQSLSDLRKLGIHHQIMLSGDRRGFAQKIASELDLDEVYSELLPQHKVSKLTAIELVHPNLAYVGDGINDAPTLARSKVGIALGPKASDAAMEAADIVILEENLHRLADLKRIASKTSRIVWANIAFALGIKVLVMALGAFGYASMWLAVFADTGVAILAVLNALRILFYQPAR